jgi:hypothetical protein
MKNKLYTLIDVKDVLSKKEIGEIEKSQVKKEGVEIPRVGDIIYIDTELHLSHGVDDIRGGKTRILSVTKDKGYYWLILEAFPFASY